MAFVIPIAQDNAEAMKRVGDRLQSDVGSILAWAKTVPNPPFWAIARTLFPIAESISYLLIPDVAGTSERLSELFNNQLTAVSPKYSRVSHIICQIWRHGLTHGDEPPALLVQAIDPIDRRAMSWRLILNSHATHLEVGRVDAMNGQVSFSLENFYQDLLDICRNPGSILAFGAGEVSERYNQWTIKGIDAATGTQEQRKAAQQILILLP